MSVCVVTFVYLGVKLTKVLLYFFTGEWVLFLVCVGRDYVTNFVQPDRNALNSSVIHSTTLGRLGLHGLYRYVLISVGLAFLTYWGIGLSLDIYFYNNRKQKVRCSRDHSLWH